MLVRQKRHRWRIAVRAVALGAVMCLVPSIVAAQPQAPVQSSDDLKARAAALADRIESLNQQADQLDEQFNRARADLATVQAKLAANEADVAAARAELSAGQDLAARYAVNAYVTGGSDSSATSADTDGTSHRRAYLSVLQGDKQQVIADLGAAQQDLSEKEAALAATKRKVDETNSRLASDKQRLTDTIAQQQAIYQQTQGQLATALAAEEEQRQQRAAAEAAARMETEAAAARAAAAAPRRVVAPTGNNDNNGDPGASGGDTAPDPGPVSGAAGTAISVAMAQRGIPYVYAGASPSEGFDCSGLTMYAYGKAGVSLPHVAASQQAMTRRVSADQAQPGDLVFYGSPPHHVGLYLGGGMMVHAPHTGDVVKVASVFRMGESPQFGRL